MNEDEKLKQQKGSRTNQQVGSKGINQSHSLVGGSALFPSDSQADTDEGSSKPGGVMAKASQELLLAAKQHPFAHIQNRRKVNSIYEYEIRGYEER